MAASERIDKFFEDFSEAGNVLKAFSHIKKLIPWLQKHQDEVATASAKSRLIELVGKAVTSLSLAPGSSEHADIVIKLLEMYCALPEGKLVSSKGKSQALKWLNAIDSSAAAKTANSCASSIDEMQLGHSKKAYLVLDVDVAANSMTLESTDRVRKGRGESENEDSRDILEGVHVADAVLLKAIADAFEAYLNNENYPQPEVVMDTADGSVTLSPGR